MNTGVTTPVEKDAVVVCGFPACVSPALWLSMFRLLVLSFEIVIVIVGVIVIVSNKQ